MFIDVSLEIKEPDFQFLQRRLFSRSLFTRFELDSAKLQGSYWPLATESVVLTTTDQLRVASKRPSKRRFSVCEHTNNENPLTGHQPSALTTGGFFFFAIFVPFGR